jgi:molybdate transport system permease protein
MVVAALAVAAVLFALAFQLTSSDLFAALRSRETFFALSLSLMTSVAATVLALLFGVPSGYALARRDFPGKSVIETLLDLPLVIPPLVVGMGLLFLLGPDLLGGPLAAWGIRLVFSPWGAVVAQAFIATAIVIRTAKATFEAVDQGYESAGLTLGLGPAQVFGRVTLPLAFRGLVSGAVLAWARCMGEFGATLMVAGATRMRTETLPIAIYLNISSGETGIALACALVLMAASFLLLVLLRWAERRPGKVIHGPPGT